MNQIIEFIKRFSKFVFWGELPPRKIIKEQNTYPSEEIVPVERPSSKEQVKNQLITQINRVLMLVCLMSFAFIIIYPFFYPEKAIPDIIQNAFFTTLGWFGGVLSAFFQVETNKNN